MLDSAPYYPDPLGENPRFGPLMHRSPNDAVVLLLYYPQLSIVAKAFVARYKLSF